jgi:hypothetical protein
MLVRSNHATANLPIIYYWFVVSAGVYISSVDDLFTKDRTDAIADFYEKSHALSIQAARKQGKYAFLRATLFHNVSPLCWAGLCTGLGVCVMHYIGMVAMQFNGSIIWNKGIIAASVLIAIIASTAAYWILFRLLVVFPSMEVLRVASAVIAAIAVNGMHYTGMAAATFVIGDSACQYASGNGRNDASSPCGINIAYPHNLVPQLTAMYGAIVSGIVISFVALAFALNDLRGWFYAMGRVMRELDMQAETVHPDFGDPQKSNRSLQGSEHSEGDNFLNLYRNLRGKSHSGKKANQIIIQMRLDHKRASANSSNDDVLADMINKASQSKPNSLPTSPANSRPGSARIHMDPGSWPSSTCNTGRPVSMPHSFHYQLTDEYNELAAGFGSCSFNNCKDCTEDSSHDVNNDVNSDCNHSSIGHVPVEGTESTARSSIETTDSTARSSIETLMHYERQSSSNSVEINNETSPLSLGRFFFYSPQHRQLRSESVTADDGQEPYGGAGIDGPEMCVMPERDLSAHDISGHDMV